MDVREPRVRRRGFFVHVEPYELDPVEHDTAEGVSIRLSPSRKATHSVRGGSSVASVDSKSKPQTAAVRSATATGSRQQARTHR